MQGVQAYRAIAQVLAGWLLSTAYVDCWPVTGGFLCYAGL